MSAAAHRHAAGPETESWRRPAPGARAVARTIFSWRRPVTTVSWSLVATLPFIAAALTAPALLSVAPTVELLAPIADARALASGASSPISETSPVHLVLLLIADLFFDAPGKVHLAAKAIAALLIAAPLAYFASARFPFLASVALTAAAAAFVAAPFSGPAEFSLALFATLSAAFLAAPADHGRLRAVLEGVFAGMILVALWFSTPAFALLGFLALSACPFLTGGSGLWRYGTALGVVLALVAASEILSPGLTIARALAATATLADAGAFAATLEVGGLAGLAASTAIVIGATAIFGGQESAKGWATAACFLVAGYLVARLTGAQPAPIFLIAAAFAAFSIASPFYDGVFRSHDRASIALAGSVAALTLFWTVNLMAQTAGQYVLQYRTAARSPESVSAEFGLIQPGGPTIARWIEEGRFSTPEAREFFSLSPIDQTAMLLDAAARAKTFAKGGLNVAILTGADTACVIEHRRDCSPDGKTAAAKAKIVFVPRLDLDNATADIKDRSSALLYTEFKMAEVTPLWEIWVRRGENLPLSAAAQSK